jgi:hypothetical protein
MPIAETQINQVRLMGRLFYFLSNRGNLLSIEGIGGLGESYRGFVQTVFIQNASNDR